MKNINQLPSNSISTLEQKTSLIYERSATYTNRFYERKLKHIEKLEKKNMYQMIDPLDGRNTKEQKTKTADFFVNTGILVKLFQKKPKY